MPLVAVQSLQGNMREEEKPSRCRVCLTAAGQEEKLMSLFEQMESCLVYEHIVSVASVSISPGDGLPMWICAACLLELQGVLDFRNKCETSDHALRAFSDPHLEEDSHEIKREPESSDELTVEYLDDFAEFKPELKTKLSSLIHKPESNDVQCHECQTTFKSKCKLRVHWKREHRQRKFVCPTCKRVFKTSFAYYRHRKSPVQSCKELLNNYAVQVEGEGKTRMFQCTQCPYKVNRWIHMRQHIIIHTPWDKPFKCNLCSHAYSQVGTLKQHKAAIHGEVIQKEECHICGKVFPTRRNLNRHFLKHEAAKVRCPVCNILVKTKVSLRVHMKRHSGIKSYTCEQCAAAFYASADLANHRRIHHTEKQFFKCELCEYRAPRKTRLLTHEAGHAGNLRIPCIKCGKFYETSHHLNVHLVKYHKPKKFKCTICSALFVSRKSTKRHIRDKHGQQYLESQVIIDMTIKSNDMLKSTTHKSVG